MVPAASPWGGGGLVVAVVARLGVLEAVDSKVASLAGRDDVGWICAEGLAFAKVGEGEHDSSLGEDCFCVVCLDASV